jgi:hypothetical protein
LTAVSVLDEADQGDREPVSLWDLIDVKAEE